MVQAPAEIPEAEAEGKTKVVYDQIKSVLRTPLVPFVFRTLARYPDFLQVAWEALKPNVQTAFFESRSDELRALAVDRVSSLGTPSPIPEGVRSTIDAFQYLTPKLLLATAALRSGSQGQQPKLMELTRDEKRQIVPGVPGDAPTIKLLEPAGVPILGQIEAEHGGLSCIYRALGQWPEYLRDAWESLQTLEATPTLVPMERQLRKFAEETVVSLPYRMDINPHVMRHSGLSEHDLDAVQIVLTDYAKLLPRLTAQTAFLASAQGRDVARRTPYPATML